MPGFAARTSVLVATRADSAVANEQATIGEGLECSFFAEGIAWRVKDARAQ